MIDIENLIHSATKNETPDLGIYRLIKAEFLRWQKDNPGKNFDESVEQKILRKMYDQRKESYKIYVEAGRDKLAEIEAFEAGIIAAYLPKEVSPEDIENLTRQIIIEQYDTKVSMRDMKAILTLVQGVYPGASGQIVSKVVKSYA